VCRRVELSDSAGPELGALLALVPAEYNLQVSGAEPVATWEHHVRPELQASCSGPTRETAIRAATVKLLGPSTCQTCLHWHREIGQDIVGAMPCRLDELKIPRTPESSCQTKYERHPCAGCAEAGGYGRCDYPWQTFRCSGCEQLRPLCKGAADAYPGLCDGCVAALPIEEGTTDPAPSSGEQPCAVIRLGLELARCDKEKP
jgi:hypothetical protein